MRITGYASSLSVAAGETVRFMVSCEEERYTANLVQLIHGDENPAGPGFKEREVPANFAGVHRGRVQSTRRGSFAIVPWNESLGDIPSLTITAWVLATMPGGRTQAILGHGRPSAGVGLALVIEEDGDVGMWIGDGRGGAERVRTEVPLRAGSWHLVVGGYDAAAGRLFVGQHPRRALPGGPPAATAERAIADPRPSAAGEPLVIGAAAPGGAARGDAHFNGRISRPAIFRVALSPRQLDALQRDVPATDLDADLVAAWDFAADIATDRITDTSDAGSHGKTVNMPTRGVVDHTFRGEEVSFRLAASGYGAIHFHEDDLEDAGWEPDFEFTVPADLGSGVYAARLRVGADEDHVPFIVRPGLSGGHERIVVLVPTLTYRVYANYLDVERGGWDASELPHLDAALNRDVYAYITEHQLFGLYDRHADGSPTCYASSLRPILNMRPRWRYRVWGGAPTLFSADLYLVDWLNEKGYQADFITDDDLHREGTDLLRPYRVVLTGSHPEYWTAAMLDGLESYLDDGGRLMYLGGNGFFGVASVDPHRPHVVEVRRWGTSWPFEVPPPERYHSTTGEHGGTWRNRGRAPNELVGVGTCAAGFDSGAGYVRRPGSDDPRAAFVFDGLAPDERIGDFSSLQVRHGAAGYEIDRHESALGSPPNTLVLASSVGHSAFYHAMLDEQLWFVDEVDGLMAASPGTGTSAVHPYIHADLVLCPRPGGGAVFSVGSMAWQSCLSYNGYDNNVSRVTQNVLDRFLRAEPVE